MFPYPSGSLHMGHARVYSVSDALSKYYSMNGFRVIHPMGWDSFGLPAENAAIERGIDPKEWTLKNIAEMKKQIKMFGCDFDWNRELRTSEPDYYRWTQLIFLMLYKDNLVYRKPAPVLWDPVDKTVLANEQVDKERRSWRSGATVEIRYLNQWFIRLTHFAKDLVDDVVEDGTDMSRATRIQRGWIGKCEGRYIDFKLKKVTTNKAEFISVFTKHPEDMLVLEKILVHQEGERSLIGQSVTNPIDGTLVPLELADNNEDFGELNKFGIPYQTLKLKGNSGDVKNRDKVISALGNKIGPLTSARIHDWCVSRQRRWGTPIPMVHCDHCRNIHPIDKELLPLLHDIDRSAHVQCTKCGSKNAQYDTDTLDTFFDSSWYFLRFLDSQNRTEPFGKATTMPVDIYIGGIEHAVTHLMAARLITKYFYRKGLIDFREPFKRFVAIGTVTGKTLMDAKTGAWLNPEEIVDRTSSEYTISWEKMSKSKKNGVNPVGLVEKYGSDFTRFHLLNFTHPRSIRKYSLGDGTSQGVLNWFDSLWKLVLMSRGRSRLIADDDIDLMELQFDCIRTVRYSMEVSLNIPTAIVATQNFTRTLLKTLRKSSDAITLKQLECICTVLKILYPLAPVIASQLWSCLLENELVHKVQNCDHLWNCEFPRLPPDCKLPVIVQTKDRRSPNHFVWIPRADHNRLKSFNGCLEYLKMNTTGHQEAVKSISDKFEFVYRHDYEIVFKFGDNE
ncbi:hypothetical protein ACOME3_007137 [Neoechinorhynchus agilis]